MKSPRKPIRYRCLALLLGLLAGVVVTEIVLRVGDVEPERYLPPRWLAWDGTGFRRGNMWGDGLIKRPSRLAGIDMGEYTPGARFRVEYDSNPRGYFDERGGVEMRINAVGLRGPEIAKDKPADTLRVLGLGDSFTFGVGVRDEDTFLRRLETRLRGDTPCQVLNAGTQGYNTRDQLLTLENRWLAFEPDIVLVIFYLNDVYRDEAEVSFWNNGEGEGVYLHPDGAARFSRLAHWIQHTWRTRQLRQRMLTHYNQAYFTNPSGYFEQGSGAQQMDWPASRRSLERIAALGRTHGFRVGLAIFPELISLNDEYPFTAIHDFVAGHGRELGLPVLDLLSVFGGRVDRDLWVHPTDHHPNEAAHALVAEALYGFVRDRLLSPARGGSTE